MALPSDEQMKAMLRDKDKRAAFLKSRAKMPEKIFRGCDLAQPGSDRTAVVVWHRKTWHRRLWERIQAWWRYRVRGEPIERTVTPMELDHWEIVDR